MNHLCEMFAPNILSNANLKKFAIDHVFSLTNTVGLVMEGVVAEDALLEYGDNPITLRLAGPNALINLGCIFNERTIGQQFCVETPQAVVALINVDHFRNGLRSRSLEAQAAVSQELMSRLHLHIQEIAESRVRAVDGPIEDRIAWAIRRFQEVAKSTTAQIRKKRIAAHLGVAPEHVSRVLAKMENEGKLQRTRTTIKFTEDKV